MRARTLKILAALLGAYVLLALAGMLGPPFERVSAPLILAPFFSAHVFHKLGVPGLLEQGGNCGWGWCSPTPLGWVLVALFWLGIAWLAAWGLARLTMRRNG